jgi:low affinity Fe/Cu permease
MEDRIPNPEERPNRFDNFAERSSTMVSGAPFFAICVLLIVGWIPTLWLVGSEPSQFVLQTVIAIVTLLLVALLQNSQERAEEAVNLKLDAIAQGVADLMKHHTGDDQDLHDNIDRLAKTVGLELRVSSSDQRSAEENGGK